MKIALVNPITMTADLQTSKFPLIDHMPQTDCDLNIVEMARRVARMGHDVTVFAADAFLPKERCPDEDGLHIEYLPTRLKQVFPPAVCPMTPALVQHIKRDGYDAVMLEELFSPATLLGWWAKKGVSGRFFIWQELDTLMRGPAGIAQHYYYRFLGRRVSSDASSIIPRSIFARRHLEAEGIPSNKINAKIVHSGVDCARFRPTNRQKARDHFKLDGFEDVLLCVGRLHPSKGIDRMLRSMPDILKQRKNAVLVLKGTGPQEGEIRSLIAELALGENVRIMTERMPIEDMPLLFNCADILTITSRNDLLPFNAIEAISCGIPIANTLDCGLRTDIVEQGGGVMLPEDEKDFSKELSALLADKDRLRQIGHRARQLAEEDFDFGVGARRLVEIFGSCN
jgi:glycosyltransferase involved in cell wall biosynthesis